MNTVFRRDQPASTTFVKVDRLWRVFRYPLSPITCSADRISGLEVTLQGILDS